MTNRMSIAKAKSKLFNEGVINISEDIYTKNGWRKQGYKVDKDAVPVTTVPLYIYAPHNVYDKKNGKVIGKKKMLFVWANFYTQSQVTEIKTRRARV